MELCPECGNEYCKCSLQAPEDWIEDEAEEETQGQPALITVEDVRCTTKEQRDIEELQKQVEVLKDAVKLLVKAATAPNKVLFRQAVMTGLELEKLGVLGEED